MGDSTVSPPVTEVARMVTSPRRVREQRVIITYHGMATVRSYSAHGLRRNGLE